MGSLMDQLPGDQQELIMYRLGTPRIRKIEKKTRTEDREIPRKGSHVPRVSSPITAFYWGCLSKMGSLSKTRTRQRRPSPTKAWIEVLKQAGSPTPNFTHKDISDAVGSLGGLNKVAAQLRMKQDLVRKQFIMAYKEMAE